MEGYIGLFLSAFLAATIIPFSSEVLLGGMAVLGKFATEGLLAAASIGNTLGASVPVRRSQGGDGCDFSHRMVAKDALFSLPRYLFRVVTY